MGSPRLRARVGGFTLVELLVVIAVIAILASLLMPALIMARMKAQGTYCMGNLKQMQVAWDIYSHDFNDYLAPNSDRGNEGKDLDNPAWVAGTMSYLTDPVSLSECTNTDLLVGPTYSPFGSLGPYTRNAGLYRCPGDKSRVNIQGTLYARVRSISMNSWVGCETRDWLQPPSPPNYKLNFKMSDMQSPAPSDTWILMDEREDSINDGWFAVDMVNQGGDARLVDLPAAYHNRAGTISFADGHCQLKKWVDPRTTPPMFQGLRTQQQYCPNNPDVTWVQAHTTGLQR